MKTLVIVAGLGKFYGAGRRLYLQLCKLRPKIEPIFIDAEHLTKIAQYNGINEYLFSPDIRGYGFWSWKPLLIYHYLNELDGEGNCIYIDAGCDIYPPFLMRFIEFFNESPFKLLLSHTGHNISKYTKPDVIKELNKSGVDLENTMMLQAGFICIKVNSNIKRIFEDAYELILYGRQDLFNDEVSNTSSLPTQFIDHRHDQSVLSLLILNSPHMDEVGVLPTGLTPPQHRNWCLHPPVIASRNSSIVSLYWPLIKYRVQSEFSRSLLLQIRIMNKLAKLSNFNDYVLRVGLRIISYQFRANKSELRNLRFEEIQIQSLPILVENEVNN